MPSIEAVERAGQYTAQSDHCGGAWLTVTFPAKPLLLGQCIFLVPRRVTVARLRHLSHSENLLIIPAKAFARDYVITGVRLSVCLSVCLFVTTITK